MAFGEVLTPEPGNMVGPTKQGMDDLFAKEPGAYWDEINNKVVSTKHPSPRGVAIPLCDPDFYETGKAGGRNASFKAVNYLGFFVEEMRGNEVYGRSELDVVRGGFDALLRLDLTAAQRLAVE